jgi:hypothetical protein
VTDPDLSMNWPLPEPRPDMTVPPRRRRIDPNLKFGALAWMLKFCRSHDEGRFDFSKPNSSGAHLYAGDGSICVRIPWTGPEILNEKAADSAQLFEPRMFGGPYGVLIAYPTDAATEEDGKRLCEACGIRDYEFDEYGNIISECAVCLKTRLVPGKNRIINGFRVGAKYDAMIRTLPNVRYEPPRGRKPLRFVFDGGEGMVMGKTQP